MIDPHEPALAVFELTAEVEGDGVYEATKPYPVRIVPSELLGSLK